MKIIIAGGSGFIGSFLRRYLLDQHHELFVITRRAQKNYGPCTFLSYAQDWPSDIDVVINLAGASLAEHRWDDEGKTLIRESRIETTRFLVNKILNQTQKPKLLLQASAAGIYGSMPHEELDENAVIKHQNLFSQQLCLDWEREVEPLAGTSCRCVTLRMGMVLHPQHGVLKELLPSFKWGFGAVIGTGKQAFPWIDIDDLIKAMVFIMEHDTISGPVHMVAPQAVNQKEFAKTLAKVLRRPCWLRLPAFIIKMLFGQMGQELLLQGATLKPSQLLEAGFEFSAPTLEQSLLAWFRK